MLVAPRVSFTLPDGRPVYSITDNSQAYWWGVNAHTLEQDQEGAEKQLSEHVPELTTEERDNFWMGFVDGNPLLEAK